MNLVAIQPFSQAVSLEAQRSIARAFWGEDAIDRLDRLSGYFSYYNSATSALYHDTIIGDGSSMPALTHNDILTYVAALKTNPETSRAAFRGVCFPDTGDRRSISLRNQEATVNLCVQLLLMVNCSSGEAASNTLRLTSRPMTWMNDETFHDFVSRVFPRNDEPLLNDRRSLLVRSRLRARKLHKHADVRFIPTESLADHLYYDEDMNAVRLFNNVAFLLEHLHLSEGNPRNMGMAESLQMGTLPRQLLLETLYSIRFILFPTDYRSQVFLTDLTRRHGFAALALDADSDPGSARSRPSAHELDYVYWGSRLAHLYDVLQDPKPRGRWARWLDRRKSPRYALLAALVGIFLTLLSGLVGNALVAYQTWLTYWAWQNPVDPSPKT